jgi:hypothetical protein
VKLPDSGAKSYLVGSTALVGTEHDHVGGGVGELVSVESCVLLEELHVGATALEAVCSDVSWMLERSFIAIDVLWSLTSY